MKYFLRAGRTVECDISHVSVNQTSYCETRSLEAEGRVIYWTFWCVGDIRASASCFRHILDAITPEYVTVPGYEAHVLSTILSYRYDLVMQALKT